MDSGSDQGAGGGDGEAETREVCRRNRQAVVVGRVRSLREAEGSRCLARESVAPLIRYGTSGGVQGERSCCQFWMGYVGNAKIPRWRCYAHSSL